MVFFVKLRYTKHHKFRCFDKFTYVTTRLVFKAVYDVAIMCGSDVD